MEIIEMIENGNGNTIFMLTPKMLEEFAKSLIKDAKAELQCKEEPTYTPAQFAERWQVDKSTLWRWVREGKLKKTMVGGKVFYRDSDLQRKEA